MLQKLNFKPGFNKQDTESGAEGQWTDGDFVRFRYGLPEKIGGWSQLTIGSKTLPGAARAQAAFSSFAGEKYTAIGTSQGLFLYFGYDFYDITPLDTAITGATFTSTNNSANVTVNKTSHTLQAGDYITLSSVTVPGATSTLNGAITATATTITLADASSFSTSGSVRINDEIITYSGKSTNDLTGCTRGTGRTTAIAHDTATAVRESTVTRFNTTDFTNNIFEIQ